MADRDDRNAGGWGWGSRDGWGRRPEPPDDDRRRYLSEGEEGDYYGRREDADTEFGNPDRDRESEREYRRAAERRERDEYGPYTSEYRRGDRDYEAREYDDRRYGYGRSERDDASREDARSRGREREQFVRFDARDNYDHSRRDREDLSAFGNYPSGGRGDERAWRDDDAYGSRAPTAGQGRGWFGDPDDRRGGTRERWEGSGGARYDADEQRWRDERAPPPPRREDVARDDRDRERSEGRNRNAAGQRDRARGDDRNRRDDRDFRGYGDSRSPADTARFDWRHRNR